MAKQYNAPRGTTDVLPEDQPYWDRIYEAVSRLTALFGYGRIEMPTFEEAGLFARTTGESTDIVQKEMYVFEDRGGLQLALRPEATPSICRAYLERGMHNLPQPVRLWFWGPMFRYDRPQAGRYRQFTQFDCEIIGEPDASADAEIIELLSRLYEELGIGGLTLYVNSIGDPVCRPAYIDALRDYYADKLDAVCDDCRVRFDRNPMRLLDCKEERCQPVIAAAPRTTDHLCDPCAGQFQRLQDLLRAVDISFEVNPRLVRGLDYYTRAVFEFQPAEEGAQSTVGAGGRYDGLIELLGGRPTPATGFASGIERMILNLKRSGTVGEPVRPRVFVAVQAGTKTRLAGDRSRGFAFEDARTAAFRLASDLRRQGIAAVTAAAGRSLKAQMRHADALGAEYAAILGQRELESGNVTLRRLADGSQEVVAMGEVAARLAPET